MSSLLKDQSMSKEEGKGLNLHNPDEVAAFMSDWLRVENGDIHGVPYIAVQIAEAADRSLKAAQDRDDYPIDMSISGRGQDHADIDGLLDRLIGGGISAITTDDFPLIYRTLEAALGLQPSDRVTGSLELSRGSEADGGHPSPSLLEGERG